METKKCPFCEGRKTVIVYAKRTIGYTLADGETEANRIDEHWEDCPLCSGVERESQKWRN